MMDEIKVGDLVGIKDVEGNVINEGIIDSIKEVPSGRDIAYVKTRRPGYSKDDYYPYYLTSLVLLQRRGSNVS